MEKDTLIYGLFDETGCRYIGKTTDTLNNRFKHHFYKRPLSQKTHKNNWLKEILSKNKMPDIILLETVDKKLPSDIWADKERSWISYGRKIGWKLTNGTNGGDGVVGNHKPKTAQHRMNISAAHKGKKMTLSVKKKLLDSHLGKRPEQKTIHKLQLNNPNNTKVEQWSRDGSAFLFCFRSCGEAARSVGCATTNIVACCRGREKTVKGFQWRYVK